MLGESGKTDDVAHITGQAAVLYSTAFKRKWTVHGERPALRRITPFNLRTQPALSRDSLARAPSLRPPACILHTRVFHNRIVRCCSGLTQRKLGHCAPGCASCMLICIRGSGQKQAPPHTLLHNWPESLLIFVVGPEQGHQTKTPNWKGTSRAQHNWIYLQQNTTDICARNSQLNKLWVFS